MNIVFTRTAHIGSAHVTRDVLTRIATNRGHKIQSMVTSTTDVLVTDEWPVRNPTRKSRAAEKHGTKIINPLDFLKLVS